MRYLSPTPRYSVQKLLHPLRRERIILSVHDQCASFDLGELTCATKETQGQKKTATINIVSKECTDRANAAVTSRVAYQHWELSSPLTIFRLELCSP